MGFGQPTPLLKIQLLSSISRSNARVCDLTFVEEGGQRPSEHLAPLPESGSHQTFDIGERDIKRWNGVTINSNKSRVDVWLREKDLRRHRRNDSDDPPVRREHRWNAVRLASRSGSQSFADLLLNHHQPPIELRLGRQEIKHKGRGDVVRKIGNHTPRRIRSGDAAQRAVPVQRERVMFDDRDGRGANSFNDLPEHGNQVAIEFDGNDCRIGLSQRQRQRTESGADLDNMITGTDAGKADDLVDRSGITEKVLAQRPAGIDAMSIEERSDRGPGETGGQNELDERVRNRPGGGVRSEATAGSPVAATARAPARPDLPVQPDSAQRR